MKIDLLLQQTPALPSIPKVVQELIHTLNREDVTTSEIARQLAADQVLSAKVLRLANSAYYSVPRTISTVDEALRMLGFMTVRTLVVSAGMAGSFRPMAGVNLNRFWHYGLHTAVAAKYLARQTTADADLAFTVGLLHGIGRLVMLSGMAEDMKRISEAISPYPGDDRLEAERAAFGFTYADVGAELVRRWNFPEAFAAAITGAAAPLAVQPANVLHAVVYLAAWRARASELALSREELVDAWPAVVGDAAGLSRESVLLEMPPLAELSAGLEEMIGA